LRLHTDLAPAPEPETNTWLCDRGRMTYKVLQAGDRLHKPRIKKGSMDFEPSLRQAAHLIDDAAHAAGPGSVAVLGSPYLSLEDNLALAELASVSVKTENLALDFSYEQGVRDGILINKDLTPNALGLKAVKEAYGGHTLEEFSALLAGGKIKTLVTEAKAYGLVKAAAAAAGVRLIIFALNRQEVPAAAHAVLPYASYFETAGTFVNYQGLRRTTAAAVEPAGGIKALWAVVNKLASYSGAELHLDSAAAALGDINLK